ncbi:MAG: hypothetical protein Q8755_02925, partial [Candidatus Phytoplasma australasiaticum]|nr:hypothetical protein [Candidatus Phytoplasma australasiaticum]
PFLNLIIDYELVDQDGNAWSGGSQTIANKIIQAGLGISPYLVNLNVSYSIGLDCIFKSVFEVVRATRIMVTVLTGFGNGGTDTIHPNCLICHRKVLFVPFYSKVDFWAT